jgi:hypothetical protein
MAAVQGITMFDPPPVRPILAVRVRKEMERDIRREAGERKVPVSVEVRRRLEFYDTYHAHHAEKPDCSTAK